MGISAAGLTSTQATLQSLIQTHTQTQVNLSSDYSAVLLPNQQTANDNLNNATSNLGYDNSDIAKYSSQIASLDAQKAALVNPETQSFCLGVFQSSQGMCGMGMSMGGFNNDSQTVQLSGQDLIALNIAINASGGNDDPNNAALLQTATGGSSPSTSTTAPSTSTTADSTASTASTTSTSSTSTAATSTSMQNNYQAVLSNLQSQGITNAAMGSDGQSIVFTNSDGTTTKIYDANGNGGLDDGDYDFNTALTQFDAAMSAYNAKIAPINDQISSAEGQLTTAQSKASADSIAQASANAQLSQASGQIQDNLQQQDSENGQVNDLQGQLTGTQTKTDPNRHVVATGDPSTTPDKNGKPKLITDGSTTP